jgi:hypothetical protein
VLTGSNQLITRSMGGFLWTIVIKDFTQDSELCDQLSNNHLFRQDPASCSLYANLKVLWFRHLYLQNLQYIYLPFTVITIGGGGMCRMGRIHLKPTRLDVFTAVKVQVEVFWAMSCILPQRYIASQPRRPYMIESLCLEVHYITYHSAILLYPS